jgi:uncharacterized protein YndB with AHSA1/START domain
MTSILGTLRAEDGKGVVRMEDCVAAGIDRVWSALTDPAELAQWLGDFQGELARGGEYRARYLATGWEGTGRFTAFEAPNHFRSEVTHIESGSTGTFEVRLTPDGDGTRVVWEERGMPIEHLAGYGAGIQVHVEDLADYLAGRERREAEPRFEALYPEYAATRAG